MIGNQGNFAISIMSGVIPNRYCSSKSEQIKLAVGPLLNVREIKASSLHFAFNKT